MRRCIVEKCTNTDLTTLCHRFPKNWIIAQEWQTSLKLTKYPLDTLISKYSVCCEHFESSDYRNPMTNSLNATAVPKIFCKNPRAYINVKIKNILAPLQNQLNATADYENHVKRESPINCTDSIELLHREDEDVDVEEILSRSLYPSNESCDYPEKLTNSDDFIKSIDGTDFTMLDPTGCGLYIPYLDDTRLFEIKNEPSQISHLDKDNSEHSLSNSHGLRRDSTDSDVEVLASETFSNSEWLAAERSNLLTCHSNETNEYDEHPVIASPTDGNSTLSLSDEFDQIYEHLDRLQLIEVIKRQAQRIQELESKVIKIQLAHQQLSPHIENYQKAMQDIQMM